MIFEYTEDYSVLSLPLEYPFILPNIMNEILIFPNRSKHLFRHNLRVDEIDGDGLRISGRDHLRFSAVVSEVDLVRNKQHSKTGRLHPGEHSSLT
jgi:hypothetical protein